MISRLVEAKPEELRAFLEEAAGISKYKERRRETEHRIQHTRENLERLKDLREEIEKQLTHLQKQAKDAETLQEPQGRAAQGQRRAARAAVEWAASRGRRARARARARSSSRSRPRSRRSAPPKRSIEKLRVELADRNERFNAVQGSYYRVGAEIARLEQSLQHRKDLIQRQTRGPAEHRRSRSPRSTRTSRATRSSSSSSRACLSELGPGPRAGARRCSAARSRTSRTPSGPWSMARAHGSSSARSSRPPSARFMSRTRGSSSSRLRAQRLEKEQQRHARRARKP